MGIYDGIFLFSDLDGTLLNDDKTVPQANIAALERFIAGGGRFGVATGRTPHNIAMRLGRTPVNAPSILFNGAAIYDLQRGEYLHCSYIDKQKAKDVIREATAVCSDVCIQVWTQGALYQPNPNCWTDPLVPLERLSPVYAPVDSISEQWPKMVICYRAGELLPLIAKMNTAQWQNDFSITNSGDVYVEFLPYGSTKGGALRILRDMLGGSVRRVLAIGDYYNDIEMLSQADEAAAPINAESDVRALAQHIVCDNNRGAVADFLERAVFSRYK